MKQHELALTGHGIFHMRLGGWLGFVLRHLGFGVWGWAFGVGHLGLGIWGWKFRDGHLGLGFWGWALWGWAMDVLRYFILCSFKGYV